MCEGEGWCEGVDVRGVWGRGEVLSVCVCMDEGVWGRGGWLGGWV